MWIYDLNLYTFAYLDAAAPPRLLDWRGVAVALTAPLFALGASSEDGWRIRLSRAATFQSLSLLAICAYFARDGGPRDRASRIGLGLVGQRCWSRCWR